MVVFYSCLVIIDQDANLFLFQVLVHHRHVVPQQGEHFPVEGLSEPLVDDVHSESAFFSPDDFGGEVRSAQHPMKPLGGAIPYFHPCGKAFREFNDFTVEIRHPDFEAMRHRELVGIHKEFVG